MPEKSKYVYYNSWDGGFCNIRVEIVQGVELKDKQYFAIDLTGDAKDDTLLLVPSSRLSREKIPFSLADEEYQKEHGG